jgi:hypothetical protein
MMIIIIYIDTAAQIDLNYTFEDQMVVDESKTSVGKTVATLPLRTLTWDLHILLRVLRN